MFVLILVNLYSVRIIWQTLGVIDYGIYNVVGGVIAMFAFLKTAMVGACQRFSAYELGRNNPEGLKVVFSSALKIHFFLALIVFVFVETLGLWFVNYKLNIPVNRIFAANCVYQCAMLSLLIGIISVPYEASIVAHEHMKIYGVFSIIEATLRLILVFILIIIPADKLISYAIMMLGISIIMRLLSQLYCLRHFHECHFKNNSDKNLIKEILSYSGWSFIGNLGFSLRDQGLNVILNMFYNVAVNAAKGIANQIGGVVYGFAYNFQMAINPQIIKRYASGETSDMIKLIFSGCKFSSILVMIITIPLYFAAELFLKIWLGDIAPFTVGFMHLILITIIIDSFVGPITTGIQATGKIKVFQLIMFALMVVNLLAAWIWLKIHRDPYIVAYVAILSSIVALIIRLYILRCFISFSFLEFIRKVILRTSVVLVFSVFPCYFIYQYIPKSIFGLIFFCFLTTIVILFSTTIFGLTKSERELATNTIKNRISTTLQKK